MPQILERTVGSDGVIPGRRRRTRGGACGGEHTGGDVGDHASQFVEAHYATAVYDQKYEQRSFVAEACHYIADGAVLYGGLYIVLVFHTLGPEIKIPGKVFGGQAVGATGSEFSFQLFAPGQGTGFLHTHRNHEELYFILGGKGEFQVDGKVFPVEEGSVVRVAPAGERSVRNNGAEPLVMLCVQYRGGTFTAEDASDGNLLTKPVKW